MPPVISNIVRAIPHKMNTKRFTLIRPLLVASLIACAHAKAFSETPPTFTKDIAPILFQNCAGCHRPGEVGPFPLLTYEDARKRAKQVSKLTGNHIMPPWKPTAVPMSSRTRAC